MRSLTRGHFTTLVLVVAFLAVNVMALRWSSHLFSFKRELKLVRYGDRLPKLKDIAGGSPAKLILYFSSPKPPGFSIELVKYAEILSQRYKKDGLGIVAIVPQEIAELRTLIDHKLVTYDTIVDDNQKFRDQLGLNPGEDGVFVFDKEGLCRFSTRRPVNAEDLNQLVAMEVLKADPFALPATAETILTEGKSLGSFALLDLQRLTPAKMDEIPSKATHYFFFTADCSICSLPNYLEEFRVFRFKQLKSDDDAVLIFDYNFPRTDVLDELKKNDLRTVSYLAKEPLPRLQYSDQQYSILERTVAVIETDDQRKIREIYPLNSRVTERRGPAALTVSTQAEPNTAGVAYEQMFNNVPLSAYDVASYQGKYFLTDIGGNRLLVINKNMEVERNFARIGSGPGRLFHPGYLDIGPDGTIFVEDGGNERIVKFNQTGNYLGAFTVPEYQGFAVGAQNELFVGRPEEGHLITVYSSEGKKLRSFGELKEFPEIYGEGSAEDDAPYKIAYNRVRLATDKDGNLYVSFMMVPLLQKYSPDGKLLFERRLESPEIDRLLEAIHKTRYISTKSDGVDVRIIALDPVIDPTNGNIMVPLVDGSIYVADREGNKLSLLRPKLIDRGNGTFHPFVAGLGANGELMATPFPPKRWYRLATAANGNEARVAAR